MMFPNDKENTDASRDATKAYYTAELYKLLDELGVTIKDVADVSAKSVFRCIISAWSKNFFIDNSINIFWINIFPLNLQLKL